MVTAGSGGFGPVRQGQGAVTTLTRGRCGRDPAARCPGIRYISPGLNTRVQIVVEPPTGTRRCRGTGADLAAIRSWPHAVRQLLHRRGRDARARRWWCSARSCAISCSGVGVDPTGAIVRIKNQPFQVIGVLTSKGQAAMGQDQDDTVIVPYTTVQKKLLGVQHVTNITVSAEDGVPLDTMSDQIAALLRTRHQSFSPARTTTSWCGRSRRWPAC